MHRIFRGLTGTLFLAIVATLGCQDARRTETSSSFHGRLIGLSLERFPHSPLTALARFRTEVPTRVTVTIAGQDGKDLSHRFDTSATEHAIPIVGLYPDQSNTVIVRLESDGGIMLDTFTVTTPVLPRRFRDLPITATRIDGAALDPRFTLLLLSREFGGSREEGMFVALDNAGKVRWAFTGDQFFMAKPLPNGHLVVQTSSDLERLRSAVNLTTARLMTIVGGYPVLRYLLWGLPDTHIPEMMARQKQDPVFSLTATLAELLPEVMRNHSTLREIDLLGREVAVWRTDGYSIHHDFTFLPDGDLLALASTPRSEEDLIVRVDRISRQVERVYDLTDLLSTERPMLPRHVSDLDWLHTNAIYYDGRDSSVVVSGRNQSAIFKASLEPLELRWILANHEFWRPSYHPFLLRPVDGELDWPWGQHAPELSRDEPTRLLVYDNGNQRSYDDPAPPESSYSRAVEYQLDEERRTIRQVWEYGKEFGGERYTPVVGNAQYLPNGNRLVCFGAIPRDMEGRVVEWIEPADQPGRFRNRSVKSSAIIAEVTNDTPARTLLELKIADRDPTTYVGYLVYRAYKISLYQ